MAVTLIDLGSTGWTTLNSYNGYNYRDRFIYTAFAAGTGNAIRVTFPHSGTDYTIASCYVGIRAAAGDLYDFAATPVQVTFSGSGSKLITASDRTSDWVYLDVDGTRDIVVSLYPGGTGYLPYKSVSTSNAIGYYKAAADQSSTVDVTGYSTVTSTVYKSVQKIEVDTVAIPSVGDIVLGPVSVSGSAPLGDIVTGAVSAGGQGGGYGGAGLGGTTVSGAGGGTGGISLAPAEVDGEGAGGGGVILDNVTVSGTGEPVSLLEVVGTLPRLSGGFSINSESVLEMAGTLPRLRGGFQIDEIEIGGTLPRLSGGFSIESTVSVELAGTLPRLSGGFDIAVDSLVAMSGTLPRLSGGFDIEAEIPFEIGGTLPRLSGGFDIFNTEPEVEIAGTLPRLSGGFTLGGSGACSGVLSYSPVSSC